MKEILEIIKNVKRGPKTTIAGIILSAFGGYMMYSLEGSLEWASVEVGIFIAGAYLCLISDTEFKKNKNE